MDDLTLQPAVKWSAHSGKDRLYGIFGNSLWNNFVIRQIEFLVTLIFASLTPTWENIIRWGGRQREAVTLNGSIKHLVASFKAQVKCWVASTSFIANIRQ